MMLHQQRDIPDSATWDDETGETFGEARARFASFGPALSAFEVSRLPADTEVWSFGYGDDPAAFDAITAGEVGAAAAEDGYPAVDGYWGPFALTLPDRNQGVCPEGHPCYLSGDVRTCGIVHDDGGDTLRWYYGKPLYAIPDGALPKNPDPKTDPADIIAGVLRNTDNPPEPAANTAARILTALAAADIHVIAGPCHNCGADVEEHWCGDLEETFA
jgi:hypothetical protein